MAAPEPPAASAAADSAALRDPTALLQELSALAEDDENWEADPAYLQYLEAKYRDMECPLFMDTIPDDPSTDPQLHALQLLAYDGETPQSVAKRYKEQGKEFLSKALEAKKEGQARQYKNMIEEAEAAYQRVTLNPKPSTITLDIESRKRYKKSGITRGEGTGVCRACLIFKI